MNVQLLTHRKFERVLINILSIFAILAIALPVTQVAYAVSFSPFVGHWQAADIDGSDIRMSVGGPPSGPFQITWTESYISFCEGDAGIVRGTGQLDESDPNLLAADLHLECLTTGTSLDFHFAWRYHPLSGTLSSKYENGAVIIWRRPGNSQPPPPMLNLRVNYGHDWVESFYEGGHMAWITVTESDGVTVKATAELVTEPKDYWSGEPGFQSLDSVWLDAEGNQLESPPDILPNDWVFGWVDNGASAQTQIGEIRGMIDLAADSIEGTISAPWFSNKVEVECHSWGAPLPEEILKYDTVLPDGKDVYSCSWVGEWDIGPYQDVGVGYFGLDGHWVANAFFRDATLNVTSTVDVIANDGVCTLREAVIAANRNSPSGDMNGECPAGTDSQMDTIVLTAGNTYSLTIDRTNDTEANGDLDIWNNSSAVDLVIKVEGDGKATISQDALSVDDRVLENHEATLQIENLTITGGSNVGGGGGLLNNGTMDMIASEVIGNSVGWDGGGIWNGPSATLSIDSSAIIGNYSDVFGGGIINKGTLTVNDSEIRANSTPVKGGGITNEGALTIDHSILSANSADQGGALYNTGTALITNGTLVGGAEIGDANTAGGGGGLFSLGTLTVNDSIIEGNQANYGGGLFNWTGGMLIVSHSTVINNSANEGGGLHNKEGSTAKIENGTVFSGNHAEFVGGGIENWGTITITGSVLRENMSSGEAGDALASTGSEDSSASITASCIVGNGETAVFTNLPKPLIATGNWWGDPSGPSGVGPGSGDSISDFIDFSGWLAEAPSICAP